MTAPVIHTIPVAADFPLQSPRVVLVQPQVEEDDQNGYVLTPDSAKAQTRVFEGALSRMAKHGAHFLVLPEYSLPAVQLDDLHQMVIDFLPNGGVVVAGLDAMPYGEYARLVAGQPDAPDQATVARHGLKWVNAAAVWVRGSDGTVSRYLQAKIFPAEPEQNLGAMYEGEHVLRFQAGDFSFAVLICRDLYCRVNVGGNGAATQPISSWLVDQWHGSPVDILFWLQYNVKPEDTEGLVAVQDLVENGAVRCVVAANHAKYGKSAFYFPIGSYKPSAYTFPRSCAFHKVNERNLHRTLFRTSGPATFLFTYRPRRYNPGERGLIPVMPEGEWTMNPNGDFVGGAPIDPLAWAYSDSTSEFHPAKSKSRPDGTSRYTSEDVFAAQSTNFHEVQGQVQQLPEKTRRDITQALFRGGHGEPVDWSFTQRQQAGTMVSALAALRFTGPVHLPSGEKLVVARLTSPPRFVTVVGGDDNEMLRTCGEMAASHWEALHKCTLPGPMSVIVLHHTGELGREPIRDMVENKLRHFGTDLSPVDAAQPPLGEDPVRDQARIDGTDVAGVTAHSYQRLHGLLLKSQDVDGVAREIKKEVSP